jgi:hypothetical protein
MNELTNTRYCCHSKPLRDKLRELGFDESFFNGNNNINTIRTFFKNTLGDEPFVKIEDSYYGTKLFKYEFDPNNQLKTAMGTGTWVLKYESQSLNKELLENFAQRGIYSK